MSKARHISLLDQPFTVSDDRQAFYRTNGFVRIRQVLSVEVVDYFNQVITKKVNHRHCMDSFAGDTIGDGPSGIQCGKLPDTGRQGSRDR